VDRKIRALAKTGTASVFREWLEAEEGGEARHLPRALEAGDAVARRILQETAEDLAFGLSHAVHLLNPRSSCWVEA